MLAGIPCQRFLFRILHSGSVRFEAISRLLDLGLTQSLAMRSLHIVWILFVLTTCSGCRPDSNNESGNLSASGLFRLHCSSCHGDGSGNGHVAGTLKIRPRNLKLAEWQRSVNNERIAKVIREGGAAFKLSPDMPAFRERLSQQDIQQLVSYLRILGK